MENGRENNLLWVVGFILVIACGCAFYTAFTIEATLDALTHSQSMAVLIVDGASYVSDDAMLGEQLTSSVNTLKTSLEVSYAVVSACGIMGAGLIVRVVKRL
ncbi:hypothetical protein UFOVP144_9 [uncultured Caudovirales phage]|uniref:Uncharacterized protein n=1 Tax=uncultured Caudovirales phage TaxID=2100421 RepID=A0A6J7XLQ5_9CAUD|nr:hypothetical protein UFOVP144_9 [uncultured Caudovirales phage]